MSYKPINNFAIKDTLAPSDPEKIIYGVDLQTEFNAIASNLDLVDGKLVDAVEEAPIDNRVFGRRNGYWKALDLTGGGSGGGSAGAGMVISEDEPTNPVDGMQWLESTTAIVWIWDENKWLEFPAGKGGSDSDITYTLPVNLRAGNIELPLNAEGTMLEVITRNGAVELPLMAA